MVTPEVFNLALLALSVALMSTAQILQKRGMAKLALAPSQRGWWRPFLQPFVFIGLCCHGLLTLVWLIVLTRVEVSLAFPVLSLSFAVIVSYSGVVLGEQISRQRWAGVGLIIFGVCLLALGAADG